ncbi:nitrogen fixation protein NifQ [Gynuella sp.]|uniref:nitrogen fixation protein NifQ n=1 Tax=Gynuella sp. TaxID=2969146 RepID=UPI003D0FCD70
MLLATKDSFETMPWLLNCRWFGQMLSSQRQGQSCLPFYLGLTPEQFVDACKSCVSTRMLINDDYLKPPVEEDIRQLLLEQRQDECEELSALLVDHRRGACDSELWIAQMVVAGCMGGGHLWHDLGLPNRTMLNELLSSNFPSLAQQNVHDMKWKKFLYRQLCERGGDYVCRAPSCQECQSFNDCYGNEEHIYPPG